MIRRMCNVFQRARTACSLFLTAVACIAAVPVGAVNVRVPVTADELKVQLENIMRDEHVPGMSVVLAKDGKIAWQATFGVANVARSVPVVPATKFRIGDLSKGFIALAALKLQEQGKLKLTDTLAQWAPELELSNAWSASDPVRLVHLLEHTAGLSDMSLKEYAHNEVQPIELKQALLLHHNLHKVRWRPGSRAAHSSVGPALVAYVIEKVSGQRFEDYVAQQIFMPIGMKSATYLEPHANFAGQYAADGTTALPYWNQLYRSSGAVNASIGDMGHYLQFLLNRGAVDGVQLVSAASIERLERPETLGMVAFGVNIAPALGMLNTIEDGVHFRGHFGIVNGGLSEILYIPEQRTGFVVMMNSLNEFARSRVLEVLQAYLVQGVPRPKATPAVQVAPRLRADYEGYYIEDSPTSERMRFVKDFTDLMHVRFTERGMIARNVTMGYAEKWEAQTGQTFRQPGHAEPMVAMYRAQDGEFVMQSKWGTLRKVSTIRAFAPLVLGAVSVLLMLSSLVAGMIWLAKQHFRPAAPVNAPSIYLLPMAASTLFIAIVAVLSGGMNLQSLWGPWGHPGMESFAALFVGIAFLICSMASVVNVFRYRRNAVQRVSYWHAAMASGACLLVAGYLLYWKAIGVPVWVL
jgi:CubicO group peptidase (beta-lactamase class C family)